MNLLTGYDDPIADALLKLVGIPRERCRKITYTVDSGKASVITVEHYIEGCPGEVVTAINKFNVVKDA